ncbi:hypothetical protein SAMN04515672_1481 [Natronorubrum texcoconense]|uniref:Uncharacterized protein n=2 Tax=Natronorubrum texcoconense TaxID=1095776 RepID=A0A1G8WRR1_9EURY|nr:hypothetical protein SAMN04515672_1481 [Natronorubrum texcoconense]
MYHMSNAETTSDYDWATGMRFAAFFLASLVLVYDVLIGILLLALVLILISAVERRSDQS